MIRLHLIFLFFASIAFLNCPEPVHSAQNSEESMLLLKNGNNKFVTGAIIHLQEAIFKEQQQDFAGAILEYQDVLRYDSTASIAYYGLAENYLNVRKEERAAEALEKYLHLKPDDIEMIH